jgi:diguanylate cyclase (GGDEF)-like protein
MISSKKQIKFNKAHYVVFCFVFLCGIGASLALLFEERSHVNKAEKAMGADLTDKLNGVLSQYKLELDSVVALIQSNKGEVSSRHFSRFVQNLTTTPGISLYFAQYLPKDKKYEYELQQRVLLGNSNFTVFPDGDREEYMPLALVYPDKIPYGYDILSSQYRDLVSVHQARISYALVASKPSVAPFINAGLNDPVDTIIFSTPIYLPLESRSFKLTDSIGFHGIVGAYFSVKSLLNLVAPSISRDLLYRIADISSGDPIWFVDSATSSAWEGGGYYTYYLSVADRKWRVDTRHAMSVWSQIHWLPVVVAFLVFSVIACLLSFYIRKLSLTYYSALGAVNKRIEVDELTGLSSRYHIQHKLNELIALCREDKKQLATLILDLDHFKTINDAFGHELGDKLLFRVSQRLSSILPDDAVIGYLGGDAFLVLLVQNDHQDTPTLDIVAKELIEKISQSYFVEGLTLNIGCSIGVAMYPEFGSDAVTLIKNADMAVYQAKTLGRATYHFYDGEMGRRFARNVRIETRLRKALQTDGLELHFQPKVDLITERCVGVEALLRWEDEELGTVSPAEFIPIAEQTGVILPLGDWVFEQAFRHIVEWQEQGITVPPIAINCSAAQLKRVDFLPNLLSLLDKYKIDPSLLEIEVTESILIEDAESCAELLRQISRIGMKLAIDDFGTGYSSLSYLKDLPFHYVKIDQVFIRDIIEDRKHAALTHAIISLGHNLNLKVIAEGITSIDQLIMLQEFGCDIGQGYLFSKALGANSMGSDPMIVALNEQEGLDKP